jgi:hypothetical protein
MNELKKKKKLRARSIGLDAINNKLMLIEECMVDDNKN